MQDCNTSQIHGVSPIKHQIADKAREKNNPTEMWILLLRLLRVRYSRLGD
jgi:hypothetical protein